MIGRNRFRATVLTVFTVYGITSLVVVTLLLPAHDRFGAFVVGGLATLFWTVYAVLERLERDR